MKNSIVTAAAKHQQLAHILQEKITAGEFEVGATFPSDNAIARDYGVAVGTVREALSVLVNQGLIQREKGRGTSVCASSATQPEVSFITDTMDSPLFSELTAAIESSCAELELPLSINLQAHGANSKRLAYRRLRNQQLRGILLGPVTGQEELDEVLKGETSAAPLIVLACLEKVNAHFVTANRTPGVMEAVEHLYQLGHRRIALLSTQGDHPFGLNFGFRRAVEHLGLAHEECPVLVHPFIYRGDEASSLVRELYADGISYTALIVHNDVVAMEVMAALSDLSVRVPEDVSLIGCDNIFMARHASVPLTTIDLQIRHIGAQAIETLMAVTRQASSGFLQTVIPARLMMRQTTARAGVAIPHRMLPGGGEGLG